MINFTFFPFKEIDSTNAEAKRNIDQYPHGSVIWATSQSAGKGRLNRNWISPPDKNLYLSLVIKEADLNYRSLNPCVQVAALAIWKCLHDLNIENTCIKWPNDVLIGESKISGILCESVLRKGKIEALIIGIGLNINMYIDDFSELNRAATSTFIETGIQHDIGAIRQQLLKNIQMYYQMMKSDLEDLTESWLMASQLKDAPIQFTSDQGKTITGHMRGINPEGALIIQDHLGLHTFYTGELKRL